MQKQGKIREEYAGQFKCAFGPALILISVRPGLIVEVVNSTIDKNACGLLAVVQDTMSTETAALSSSMAQHQSPVALLGLQGLCLILIIMCGFKLQECNK